MFGKEDLDNEIAEDVISAGTETVTFGRYVQEEDGEPEPIEWLVLEKNDDTALLISRYALDCRPYHDSRGSVTWETCSLRKWLNGAFLTEAFSSEEQSRIICSPVTADKNPDYGTSPGSDTEDRVFLLSIKEAEKYFRTDEARKCAPTDYAKSQGAWTGDIIGGRSACWWWLRSPGLSSFGAASVRSGGSVVNYGNCVDLSNDAVRPALRINL